MKRFWTVAGAAALLFVGCTPKPAEPDIAAPAPEQPATASTDQPVVLATIFPIADITSRIAGDGATVEPLMPPGASPHTFELTPVQATLLSKAAAVIAIGPGIDGWVTSKVPAGAKVLTLAEHTELRHGFHHEHAEGAGHDQHGEHEEHEAAGGDADPHIWLDPVKMRDDLAPAIAALLTELMPDQTAAIQQRLIEVQTDLTALDAEIAGLLKPVKDAAYVTAHPAWGYFDTRYGLKMAGVIESAPGKDPSGQQFGELVKESKTQGVRAVMAEKQQNKALAERLGTDLGVPVGLLDPLGGKTIEGCNSYRALMLHNAHQFAKVLTP